MKYHLKVVLLLLMLPILAVSCRKFLDVGEPSTAVDDVNVYKEGPAAAAALTTLYRLMITGLSSSYYTTVLSGLYVDELENPQPSMRDFYLNNVSLISYFNENYWASGYNIIFKANAIYEGCRTSTTQSTEQKKQLMGEALFIRAYYHFNLTNFYGDVPLVLGTNSDVNEHIARSPQALVYQQIIQDLETASDYLSDTYLSPVDMSPGQERVRPCKAVARALLARAYLYDGKWREAEQTASSLINDSLVYSLVPPDQVFLKNSKEAVFQLMMPPDNDLGINTMEAPEFVSLPGAGKPGKPLLSASLVNAFEPGDRRRAHWVGSVTDSTTLKPVYFPYKYKVLKKQPITEYTMVLRLAEQFLIRAEARLQLGNFNGCLEDVNRIRKRARLPLKNSSNTLMDFKTLAALILHERQVELFCEQGHRWFDVKRTSNIEIVMGRVIESKGITWATGRHLLPIPQHEMILNDSLTQNPGY